MGNHKKKAELAAPQGGHEVPELPCTGLPRKVREKLSVLLLCIAMTALTILLTIRDIRAHDRHGGLFPSCAHCAGSDGTFNPVSLGNLTPEGFARQAA